MSASVVSSVTALNQERCNGVIQRGLAVGGGGGRQSADSATDNMSLRPPDGLRPRKDVPLIALDAEGRFRLACDSLQWIIQSRKGEIWAGQRFLTTRKVLLRDLQELGCELTVEACAAVESLPERFDDWLEGVQAAEGVRQRLTERRTAKAAEQWRGETERTSAEPVGAAAADKVTQPSSFESDIPAEPNRQTPTEPPSSRPDPDPFSDDDPMAAS